MERIRTTTLYRYELLAESFSLLDGNAGHWVSRATVEPLAVEPVDDLLAALAASDVELRITPRLMKLWRRAIDSTLAYSGTRLRNAQGYGEFKEG